MLCLQHGEMMVLLLSSNHKAFQMCFNDLEQSGKTEVVNARLVSSDVSQPSH